MRWTMRQISQSAQGSIRFSSGFQYVYLGRPPVNGDVLMTDQPDQSIEISATGPWVKLIFHTHAWSGSIIIETQSKSYEFDLYSEEHGFRDLILEGDANNHIHAIIKTGGAPNESAKARQTWITGVEFSEEQIWYARSMPVTPACTLTHGKYGVFLTLTQDTTIGAAIVQDGIWAPRDVELFETLIEPGMVVLDVGANIGHHSVVYSKLVGQTGRVVAFEPQTTIFRLLAANCVMNGAQNTDLVQACVGEDEGFVHLFPIDYASATNFGGLGIDPKPESRGENRGQKCRVARLDALLSELFKPIQRCDFIKIDVQSFELFVLKGAEITLKMYRPILFLEISPYWMSKMYDYREIYNFLWGMGYEIEHLSDPTVKDGEIKIWSGANDEEWDILARPKRYPHIHKLLS
jgi:FkbM family methyltransferase